MRLISHRAEALLQQFFDPPFAALSSRVDALAEQVADMQRSSVDRSMRDDAYFREACAFREDAADWLRYIVAELRSQPLDPFLAPPVPEPLVAIVAAAAGSYLGDPSGTILVAGPEDARAPVALALSSLGHPVVARPTSGSLRGAVLLDGSDVSPAAVRDAIASDGVLLASGGRMPGGDEDDLLDLGPAWRQTRVWSLSLTGPAGGWPTGCEASEPAFVVVAALPA